MKKAYFLLFFGLTMATCTHRSMKRHVEPVATAENSTIEYTVESLRVALSKRIDQSTVNYAQPYKPDSAKKFNPVPMSGLEPIHGYQVPE